MDWLVYVEGVQENRLIFFWTQCKCSTYDTYVCNEWCNIQDGAENRITGTAGRSLLSISRGTILTQCDGISSDNTTVNLPFCFTEKEFRKTVSIWQSCGYKYIETDVN